MSTVISKNVQIGADGTASNNFTAYQPATPDGTLRIGNGNSGSVTDAITLTSAGNVGIGTSSPASKLHIYSASNISQIIQSATIDGAFTEYKNGTSDFYIGVNNSAGTIVGGVGGAYGSFLASYGAYPLAFGTNGAERVRIDSAGNVGIGTSSPSVKLHVSGGNVRISNTNNTVNSNTTIWDGAYVGQFVWNQSNTANSVAGIGFANGGSANGQTGIGSVAEDATPTLSALAFYTGGSGRSNTVPERVRITSTGNVGIGTSSPAADSLIHVFAATDKARISVQRNGVSKAYMAQDGSGDFYLWNEANANIRFYNNNTERARIDSSGNLLVGTTSVSGKTTIDAGFYTGLFVKNTGGAAYTPAYFWNATTTGDSYFAVFSTETSQTLRGTITYNRGAGLVAYNTTSDYRAKTVNGAVQNALSKVALLKPSTGRMNEATQDIDFFVAHELKEVVPSAVTGEKDAVNGDNTPKYQMVDKSALIPLLTAAIQEQQALIVSLTARLDAAGL